MNKIIIFDDECNFCNKSVQFILEHEKNEELKFTGKNSNYVKNVLRIDTSKIDSVIYIKESEKYLKSKAVFEISKELKFPYNLFKIFNIFPNKLSDKIYDFIAKRRKNIVKTSCKLPTKSLKNRFIE